MPATSPCTRRAAANGAASTAELQVNAGQPCRCHIQVWRCFVRIIASLYEVIIGLITSKKELNM